MEVSHKSKNVSIETSIENFWRLFKEKKIDYRDKASFSTFPGYFGLRGFWCSQQDNHSSTQSISSIVNISFEILI